MKADSINSANRRPCVGVMGSSSHAALANDERGLALVAGRLGQVIAERGCVLVTGATTGLPDIVSRAARRRGGWTIGVSPAPSCNEHVSEYSLPYDGVDVMVYTGFGLKGRNVINIRTSDIVIIFGGGIGTLNEFTIAYDEGKVIGVLEGTGGLADRIKEIISLSSKDTGAELVFESDPEVLVDRCLQLASERNSTY
jgi:uncharacterized protein (TIGR00725 family)